MTSTAKTRKKNRRKSGTKAKGKAAKSATPPRVALVVLGMHRSGTSALSGVLDILGCDMPATPMAVQPDNPKGFFESRPISSLNDDLLHSAGTRWDDWLEFPPGWYDNPLADDFRILAKALLQEEYGQSRLFVLKDPRICRIVPFWKKALKALDIEARYALIHRNPLEVAASMEQRNGIDRHLGHLIWLRHVLDAEASTRGRPRVFTSFDRLMGNWPGVADVLQDRLNLHLPRLTHGVAAEVDSFLSTDMTHHHQTPQDVLKNPLLTDWVRDTYAILESWADKGEAKADYRKLDAIRDIFGTTAPAFVRLVQAGTDNAAQAQAMEKEKKQLEAELAEAETVLEQARSDLKEQRRKMAEAEQGFAAARSADQAAHEAALSVLRQKADQARQASEKAEAEIISLHDAKTVLAEKNAVREQELEDQLNALQDELAATKSALEQRRHETEDTARELRELKAAHKVELTAAQERAERAGRDLEDLTKAFDTEKATARQLGEEAERQRREISDLDAQLAARTREMAEVTQLLAKSEERIAEVAEATVREVKDAAARQADDLKAAKESHEIAVAAMRKELDKARAAHLAAEEKLQSVQDDTLAERKRLQDAEAALKEARERAERAEKRVRTMTASKSWRVTAPLRKIMAIVTRSG